MFSFKRYDYPIIVIGAGAGGLVIAIGAAKAGKKVLLIEKGNYGGDCTNFGCIPSKSLIAAAHTAHAIKHADQLGIDISLQSFDSTRSLQRTRDIIAEVKGHENPKALADQGVETLTGIASFENPHTLKVTLQDGGIEYVAGEHIVIATGSYPNIPPIPGLQSVPYLTNETIFDLKTIPERLGIIGGGPIGSELAQAFQRLGSNVSIIQRSAHLLNREDMEVQQVIEKVFEEEGMALYLNHQTTGVRKQGDHIAIKMQHNSQEVEISVSHLLIAVGRKPSIEKLNLDTVDIAYEKKGIVVDPYGRTSQKHIWAVGDVAGHAIFTHVAENEARTVLTNLLVPWPLKWKEDRKQAIPRVTYTDPEIASVGLNEEEAFKQYGKGKIAIYHIPFSQVDRALTTGRMEGFAKVITKKWSSQIIGATIVGPRAGEMLLEITTAMREKIPLRKLSSLIHPYPTYSHAIRKAADQWLTKTILPALFKKENSSL